MTTALGLTRGVDFFTALDLLKKAAAHKGLKLPEGATRAYCEPIKVYNIDRKSLELLAKDGIRLATQLVKHRVFNIYNS